MSLLQAHPTGITFNWLQPHLERTCPFLWCDISPRGVDRVKNLYVFVSQLDFTTTFHHKYHSATIMICTRCLRLRLLPTSSSTSRLTYSTSRLTYSTSASRTPPPPATSTSAAQPFSTPFTPSPYPADSPTHPPKHAPSSIKPLAQQQQPVSSLKAGTVLKGLGFEKNKESPVAREDWEYPDWLWGLLGQGKEEGGKGGGGGDAFCKWALFLFVRGGGFGGGLRDGIVFGSWALPTYPHTSLPKEAQKLTCG